MGMSVAEYELQKTTGRFRVLDDAEAFAFGLRDEPHPYDSHYHLVEFVDSKPVRIVGSDGGSPEDQSLVRDWQWVAVEMNALAAETAEPKEPT